jgi:hypothetical protein
MPGKMDRDGNMKNAPIGLGRALAEALAASRADCLVGKICVRCLLGD